MPPLIKVENLSFWRENGPILSKVNWTVNPGDHWVIFGPNGSGKTTILKILTGYLFPSEGSVSILGQTIGQTDIFELRKKVGWVSASLETLIHDEDAALEIVLAGRFASTRLWFNTSEAEDQKALSIMKMLGLADKAKKNWEVLSQGERKKVLIARALMTDPEILILDEPCEGLDLAARERFLAEVSVLAHKNPPLTMLLVTHHVEEISSFFNKMMILKAGKVVAQDDLNKLLTNTVLSQVFEIPVHITEKNGHYYSAVI